MALTLALHQVRDLMLGDKHQLDEHLLIVDVDDLRRTVLEDSAFDSVEFEIAYPGESCRAGPIFDIVEPRAKAPGGSPDWPGILGPPQTAGFGTTHVLQGSAVTMLREESPGESRGVTGYVLQMNGEAGGASCYSKLCHLIVIPHTKRTISRHTRHKAYRIAQLRVAVRLAQIAIDAPPTDIQVLDTFTAPDRASLMRVAYVGQIFSRQRKPEPEEQILYGVNTEGMVPTLLHPNEWLDGAITTSYHTSIGGAETYFYQNNPVVAELYRRHDRGELNFIGTVAMIAAADNLDRERNTQFAAHLAKWALGADAAVLTKFGGGVPHSDLAETARLLERNGIKTAVQVTDLARDHRVESALLFNFPEVDAIVCIGGNDTRWKLPRVERVIAPNSAMAELLAEPLEIDALNIVGVANQQGASRLRSVVY